MNDDSEIVRALLRKYQEEDSRAILDAAARQVRVDRAGGRDFGEHGESSQHSAPPEGIARSRSGDIAS
ncbi:MAG: hypothetical protein ACR2JC_11430 [Chloroflexota bacterium]|nr:MAG: hypothetical protein DLM70_17180 [Chloroflexota bacterium]